ncbi:hypothetical protein [Crateriforma conspicua]|uniref:Uncharacterized protein n=1 Tax=Crateriforma conspicua TaxID=2527996 RepID=A0A5C6FZV4_9PLAN|nr:hypothetical protein [Crateriforma conspicua]TWU67145.1 hypothetical protein V7x_27180 [Crateriforma conspicua]
MPSNSDETTDGPTIEYSSVQMSRWLASGFVYASARFVPVPFVDDVIRQRCRQYVVQTVLKDFAGEDASDVADLFSSGGGWLSGCVSTAVRAPVKLLLFPIRKIVALVTSIRGVPLDVLRMVLLGRAIQQWKETELVQDTSPNREQIERFKAAFDQAFGGIDFRLLRSSISDLRRVTKPWRQAAKAFSKSASEKKNNVAGTVETIRDSQQVRDAQQLMNRPSVLKTFQEFDARFAAAYRPRQSV